MLSSEYTGVAYRQASVALCASGITWFQPVLCLQGLNLGFQTLILACKMKLEKWDINSSPQEAKVALEGKKWSTKGSHYPQEKHVTTEEATAALDFGETGGLCIIYIHTLPLHPTPLSSFIVSVAVKCLGLEFWGLSACLQSGRGMQGSLQ